MKKLILFFAILFSLQAFAEQQNGVVYVVPNGTGTGASWGDALGDIQTAINLARSENPAARKDVWVKAGEYEVAVAINVIDSVNVYGSFQGTETMVSQRPKSANAKAWEFSSPTILKGKGERIMHATGHMDMETVIDGFVMQDGNGLSTKALNGSGGAIVVRGNVVYQNCILKNNKATGGGGGAAIMTGGTIRYSLLENNEQNTNGNGGGAIFSNPPAGYPSYIENCEIRYNSSTIRGAGIGVQGAEKTYVSNNKIYGNLAIDGATLKPGAGIYSNSANNVVVNCLIYNNTGGTAVYYNGGNLYNNTIVKNVGGLYLAGNAVKVINNVVWGCATDPTGTTATSITGVANSTWEIKNNATYNPIPTDKGWLIEENIQFSSNNSNGDVAEPAPGTVGSGPKFVHVPTFLGTPQTSDDFAEIDEVNFELTMLSPCVNEGAKVDVVIEDHVGTDRPQGYPIANAKYDIGAYELPYFTVVAGEAASANGVIYSSMGELLEENHTEGYAKGSLLELYFEPANDYKIGRAYYVVSNDGGVTFNGEEVDFTNELDQDLFWSTNVEKSFKVKVDWESLTSVSQIDASKIQILTNTNGVQINGAMIGSQLRVFSATGLLVKESVITNNSTSIALERGFYIIHLTEGVQKVLIK